jgi:hypothetical protein
MPLLIAHKGGPTSQMPGPRGLIDDGRPPPSRSVLTPVRVANSHDSGLVIVRCQGWTPRQVGFRKGAGAPYTVVHAMSGRSTDKPAQAASDADSDYDSEEDADFQDDDAISNSSSDESEAPVKSKSKNNNIESGDEATIRKSKKKRKEAENESQDLILTRAQKRAKYYSSDDLTYMKSRGRRSCNEG